MSLLHATKQRRQTRDRLYGVSTEDVGGVVQSSDVDQHHIPAAATSEAQVPNMSTDNGALVGPHVGDHPAGGIGPPTDAGSVEPQIQASSGPGGIPVDVGSEVPVAASVMVVHASVEHRPPDAS